MQFAEVQTADVAMTGSHAAQSIASEGPMCQDKTLINSFSANIRPALSGSPPVQIKAIITGTASKAFNSHLST